MKTSYARSAALCAWMLAASVFGCRAPTEPQRVISVTVSPAASIVQPQMTQQFAATVATTSPEVSQLVIWQASGDGSVSPSGLFTAGNSAGRATVTAISMADNSMWGQASVSITQPATSSQVSARPLPSAYIPSGAELYQQYCAACHGADAKGHGPAASSLKGTPTDLTTLAQHHAGQFPYDDVSRILLFGPGVAAHGSIDMPTWGTVFLYLNKNQDNAAVQQRIKNLSDYLASLQQR